MATGTIPGHLNDLAVNHTRKDFARIFLDQTVAQALEYVRKSRLEDRIVYFYVVDAEDRLHGVVPTRRLLLSPPETKVSEIMVRNLVTLPKSATLLDACEFFILHRLLALPVVDDQRRMLGIIDVDLYTDELSDLAQREESEDIFQLIGVRLAQVRQASLPTAFRSRFPWLMCNIAGGLAAALLAGAFQHVLDQVIVLALFIPVVLALAESVSIQSLTLTLQAQHGLRFRLSTLIHSLRHEFPLGMLLGLASGLLVALAALVWIKRLGVAMVLVSSIALAVLTAALLGLVVPATLRAIQRDPKVASGPIVLALTDLCTLLYYFGLAAWWLT